jgi:hypothetical protein
MNLKVIYKPLSDGEQETTSYKVSKTDKAVVIDFKTPYQGGEVERQAVIDLEEYKGRVARITLQTIWQPAEVYIAPMYELASKYRELQEVKNNAVPIARVFIPSTEDTVLVFLERPCNFTSTEFEWLKVEPSKTTTSGILIALSKEFGGIIKRHIRKRDTICDIDIYDTVTYLEAQVDALTTLVLNFIKVGDIAKVKLADALKVTQEAYKYNVLNVKSADKAIEEIGKDKKAVREMQGELFGKK